MSGKLSIIGALLCLLLLEHGNAVDKLKPEEIVAKHLDALGNADTRAKYQSCIVNGIITMGGVVGGGAGEMTGQLSILSDREKFRMGTKFPSKSYPGDNWAYDGKEVTVGFIQPGTRSIVGAFMHQNAFLVSEGVLSGVLSTNWALLHVEERKPRLSYSGLKKVGEKRYQALRYRPRKGGDEVEITLYFDPETYRHERTDLKFEPPNAVQANSAASARQVDNQILVTETFEVFQQVEGLNLPNLYRIEANVTGQRSLVYRWSLTMQEYFLNKPLDPAYFRVN